MLSLFTYSSLSFPYYCKKFKKKSLEWILKKECTRFWTQFKVKCFSLGPAGVFSRYSLLPLSFTFMILSQHYVKFQRNPQSELQKQAFWDQNGVKMNWVPPLFSKYNQTTVCKIAKKNYLEQIMREAIDRHKCMPACLPACLYTYTYISKLSNNV